MYCIHCGKELSDEAFMCPNCGTPMNTDFNKTKAQKEEPATSTEGVNTTALSGVAFTLSMIAIVTGIIYGALLYVYISILMMFIISAISVLPALAGLAMGAYLLASGRDKLPSNAKAFAITSVVLSSVVLFFLFITACLTTGTGL